MAYEAPDAADLGVFMDIEGINEPRATMLLAQTTHIAESIVTPLPEGADAVILSATARAFANPTQVTYQTAGAFAANSPFPGVYLTKGERATLRRMAGNGGGAFSINTIADNAMQGYRDPTQRPTNRDSESEFLNRGF